MRRFIILCCLLFTGSALSADSAFDLELNDESDFAAFREMILQQASEFYDPSDFPQDMPEVAVEKPAAQSIPAATPAPIAKPAPVASAQPVRIRPPKEASAKPIPPRRFAPPPPPPVGSAAFSAKKPAAPDVPAAMVAPSIPSVPDIPAVPKIPSTHAVAAKPRMDELTALKAILKDQDLLKEYSEEMAREVQTFKDMEMEDKAASTIRVLGETRGKIEAIQARYETYDYESLDFGKAVLRNSLIRLDETEQMVLRKLEEHRAANKAQDIFGGFMNELESFIDTAK